MLTRDSTEPADPQGGPITGGQVVPSHWRNTPQSGPIQLAGDTQMASRLAREVDRWRRLVPYRHNATMGTSPDPRIRYVAPSGESWVSIARRNGIRSSTFRNRICAGWEPEDAATRPAQPSQPLPLAPSGRTWVSIARDNGIHQATFHKRLRAGLTPEQAASSPSNRLPQSPNGERWRDIALRHAISRSTFYTRVANGWDPADAATTRLGGKRPRR